jgi:hypothetical protein
MSQSRIIHAVIEVNWPDYEDVAPELVLEDALSPKVDGVKIYLDEAMHPSLDGPSTMEKGERVVIPVSTLEFHQGGNTIWLYGRDGGTVFRIKCKGEIIADRCQSSPNSHSDILVDGNIDFCVSTDAGKSSL